MDGPVVPQRQQLVPGAQWMWLREGQLRLHGSDYGWPGTNWYGFFVTPRRWGRGHRCYLGLQV